MEKSKIMKVILVLLVGAVLIAMTTDIFATTEPIDITNIVDGNNTNTGADNTNTGNTNTGNTNTGTNTNATGTTNTNILGGTNNTNTSSYNNTNLPDTGIAQTGSIVCIVFALAISAIYAFKKIRDYNNI